jgi:hypothetical protein
MAIFDIDAALAAGASQEEINSFLASHPEIELKKGRGLFGTSPETETMLFPKATKFAGTGQVGMMESLKGKDVVGTAKTISKPLAQSALGGLDVIGIPGRAVASIPALFDKKETFKQAFSREEAKPETNKVGKFTSNLLRDPFTLLSTLASGGAGALKQPIMKAIGKNAAMGAATQAPVAAARQVTKSVETGKVEPKQVIDALIETGLGGLGNSVGTAVGKGAKEAGKNILKSSLKIKDKTALLAGKDVNKGVNKIVGDIAKHELQAPVGGVMGIAKNSQAKINKLVNENEKALSAYSTKNPNKTVDVDDVFLDLMDEFQKGKQIGVFMNEGKAAKIASEIYTALDLRGLGGKQPISKLPEIKSTIKEGMDIFSKGKYAINSDPILDQVGEISYLKIANELGKEIPVIKSNNAAIHDLINVRTATIEAQKRMSNWNKLGLTDAIIGAGMFSGLAHRGVSSPISMLGTAGTVVGKKIASGRGGSATLSAANKMPNAAKQVATQPEVVDSLRTFLQQYGAK